jgi:YHS domain-containing protein
MKTKILILMVTLFSVNTFAQGENKRMSSFNLEKKVALQGYDPVSYLKTGKPTKGKASITTTYEGVVYNFSSEATKEIFLKNPPAYEPQFGGWCAFAMGDSGKKVTVNPETFKIIDGKLYLFYNAFFNNTLKSWNEDEVSIKTKAIANWKRHQNK